MKNEGGKKRGRKEQEKELVHDGEEKKRSNIVNNFITSLRASTHCYTSTTMYVASRVLRPHRRDDLGRDTCEHERTYMQRDREEYKRHTRRNEDGSRERHRGEVENGKRKAFNARKVIKRNKKIEESSNLSYIKAGRDIGGE